LVDGTKMKADGEGAWNARKHGGAKRRVSRKIQIGIDEKTMEFRAAEFTTSDIGDAPMLGQAFDRWRGHPRSFLPSTPPRTTAACAHVRTR